LRNFCSIFLSLFITIQAWFSKQWTCFKCYIMSNRSYGCKYACIASENLKLLCAFHCRLFGSFCEQFSESGFSFKYLLLVLFGAFV
jgi:hypothetical protein